MIVAITGHRPRQPDVERMGVQVRFDLCFRLKRPDRVIYGGCQGVDLWAAECALNADIPLTFAKPWDTHEETIPEEYKNLYRRLETASDKVVVVTPDKGSLSRARLFQARNEWMVDHATHLCAFWDGKPSGTGNTWNYADKKIPRRNIYDWPPF